MAKTSVCIFIVYPVVSINTLMLSSRMRSAIRRWLHPTISTNLSHLCSIVLFGVCLGGGGTAQACRDVARVFCFYEGVLFRVWDLGFVVECLGFQLRLGV